ncbi:hypothetical protein EDB84DRAFT_1501603 [Lactarius hengduanensis]|nr:hypothetical protein EDB84DRAFT_1501603 [Lactarius hengduanensis]
MRISSGDTTKLLLAAALFLAASPVKSRANSISSNPQKRQWFGSAHDSLCSDVREQFLFIRRRDGPTTTVLLGDVYRV